MSAITLSAATRQSLISAQDTAALMQTTQNRLSTGKKVNSALDNPTSFFTASGLDSRASDLGDLLDGIANGVQTIQAASTGITNIQKLVDQAKSLANQALQSSAAYTTKATVAGGVNTGATSANILGGTTTYSSAAFAGVAKTNNLTTGVAITSATKLTGAANSDSLGNGAALSTTDTLTVNGTTIHFVVGAATGNDVSLTGSVGDLLTKIDALSGGTGSSVTGAGALSINTGTTSDLAIGGSAGALSALGLGTGVTLARSSAVTGGMSGTLSVVVGTGSSAVTTPTITFGTAAGQVSTLDGLNAILNASGAQASIDSTTGALSITTSNDSGAESLTISGTATGSNTKFTGGLTQTPTLGGDGQTNRNNLVSSYNALLTQIDQLSKDSSYNGVNLLNGDNLKLTFNEKNTSSLTVQGTNGSSTGLGLSTISATDFKDSTSINTVLTKITSATNNLRSQAATFGSNLTVVQNRQDFSKNIINVLQTGSANLTNADLNEEAANSQALSTRQSLAISALSLANTAQQGVLQLLR